MKRLSSTRHVVRRSNTHNCGAAGGYAPQNTPAPLDIWLIIAGTDQSQGRGQMVSNINACLAVQSTIKGTLGPYGGDLLMVDENGKQTITNDGATVMKVATPVKYHSKFLICSAPRHCSPRRPHPHRHRPIARRRSWRWHNLRCRHRWRDPKGDQGLCRAGSQQPDHHQGSAKGVQLGRQQDHGDCSRHSRG